MKKYTGYVICETYQHKGKLNYRPISARHDDGYIVICGYIYVYPQLRCAETDLNRLKEGFKNTKFAIKKVVVQIVEDEKV
jgi:hypothetical protein